MRTLLGPHPKDSPEALELEAADRSFVSAVELADLAARLAQIKGLTEPDVAGAVELLKQTWMARNALTPLRCAGMLLAFDTANGTVEAVASPDDYDRNFPGAERIKAPSDYPVSLDEAVRLISGEYNRKRRNDFLLRMENHARERMGISLVAEPRSEGEIEDPAAFWGLARTLVPHCPRFARLHGKTQASGTGTRPVRSKKSRKIKKSS